MLANNLNQIEAFGVISYKKVDSFDNIKL